MERGGEKKEVLLENAIEREKKGGGGKVQQ